LKGSPALSNNNNNNNSNNSNNNNNNGCDCGVLLALLGSGHPDAGLSGVDPEGLGLGLGLGYSLSGCLEKES
jgi:hypothetical protein